MAPCEPSADFQINPGRPANAAKRDELIRPIRFGRMAVADSRKSFNRGADEPVEIRAAEPAFDERAMSGRHRSPDQCEDIFVMYPPHRKSGFYWSYQFFSGTLTLTFAETGRIDRLSSGRGHSSAQRLARCGIGMASIVAALFRNRQFAARYRSSFDGATGQRRERPVEDIQKGRQLPPAPHVRRDRGECRVP